jgi:ABC-type transport system involved in multi-copper enzyme maturation permease subunit
MNAFFAVLKDSYREARDGYVVYVMLAIIALLMVITASLSFEAAPPQKAFETITKRFQMVFPEKGVSKIPVDARGASFSVADVKETAPGQYAFTLKAEGKSGDALGQVISFFKDKPGVSDGLRLSVVNWQKPAGKSRNIQGLPGTPPIELAQMQAATPEELKAVTDNDIVDFIKHQFQLHAGMSDVTLTRTSPQSAEPNYTFDSKVNSTSGVRGWPHKTKLFFGTVTALDESPLGLVLWIIEDQIVNGFGAGLVLLISTIVTAFFIPNMLRKGSLDLLITKPIARWQLLLYKYIGGLMFICLMSCAAVGGMWLVLAVRSGYWDPRFLLLIPILTFTFAILYAVSTLMGVLTRSGIVAIVITVGFAFVLYVTGQLKTVVDDRLADPVKAADTPGWVEPTMRIVHAVLPRYKDLDRLTTKLISDSTLTPAESFILAKGKAGFPDWGSTIGVSLAFIAVMLVLAIWRFVTRDG